MRGLKMNFITCTFFRDFEKIKSYFSLNFQNLWTAISKEHVLVAACYQLLMMNKKEFENVSVNT